MARSLEDDLCALGIKQRRRRLCYDGTGIGVKQRNGVVWAMAAGDGHLLLLVTKISAALCSRIGGADGVNGDMYRQHSACASALRRAVRMVSAEEEGLELCPPGISLCLLPPAACSSHLPTHHFSNSSGMMRRHLRRGDVNGSGVLPPAGKHNGRTALLFAAGSGVQ